MTPQTWHSRGGLPGRSTVPSSMTSQSGLGTELAVCGGLVRPDAQPLGVAEGVAHPADEGELHDVAEASVARVLALAGGDPGQGAVAVLAEEDGAVGEPGLEAHDDRLSRLDLLDLGPRVPVAAPVGRRPVLDDEPLAAAGPDGLRGGRGRVEDRADGERLAGRAHEGRQGLPALR